MEPLNSPCDGSVYCPLNEIRPCSRLAEILKFPVSLTPEPLKQFEPSSSNTNSRQFNCAARWFLICSREECSELSSWKWIQPASSRSTGIKGRTLRMGHYCKTRRAKSKSDQTQTEHTKPSPSRK